MYTLPCHIYCPTACNCSTGLLTNIRHGACSQELSEKFGGPGPSHTVWIQEEVGKGHSQYARPCWMYCSTAGTSSTAASPRSASPPRRPSLDVASSWQPCSATSPPAGSPAPGRRLQAGSCAPWRRLRSSSLAPGSCRTQRIHALQGRIHRVEPIVQLGPGDVEPHHLADCGDLAWMLEGARDDTDSWTLPC